MERSKGSSSMTHRHGTVRKLHSFSKSYSSSVNSSQGHKYSMRSSNSKYLLPGQAVSAQ